MTQTGIGSIIKSERKKLRLTQVDFSRLIDYSRTYLCEIETGRRDPGLKFIEAACKVFGMRPSTFLKKAGK